MRMKKTDAESQKTGNENNVLIVSDNPHMGRKIADKGELDEKTQKTGDKESYPIGSGGFGLHAQPFSTNRVDRSIAGSRTAWFCIRFVSRGAQLDPGHPRPSLSQGCIRIDED